MCGRLCLDVSSDILHYQHAHTSAGWQVTLCDPVWHASSRIANCYTRIFHIYFYWIVYGLVFCCFDVPTDTSLVGNWYSLILGTVFTKPRSFDTIRDAALKGWHKFCRTEPKTGK